MPDVGTFYLVAKTRRVVEILNVMSMNKPGPNLAVCDVATDEWEMMYACVLEREATAMEVLGAAGGSFEAR